MSCAGFAALAVVWLDATAMTITHARSNEDVLASIRHLHDLAESGADFIDRIRNCGLDQKIAEIETRIHLMIKAAHDLEEREIALLPSRSGR